MARGLPGVELVTSDAHQGLREAVATVFGGASWQRCRTHFMGNLLARVPKSAEALVATTVLTSFQQPSAPEVHAQDARVVEQLQVRFPEAAAMLAEAEAEILASTSFPVAHWKQVWSNNPQERLNREIRGRTNVVGIFPNRAAVVRLVGAVLSEQHVEWAAGRRNPTQRRPGAATPLSQGGKGCYRQQVQRRSPCLRSPAPGGGEQPRGAVGIALARGRSVSAVD